MSLYAAIGYVVGIMIFALFFRRHRKRMIEKHINKAKTKLSKSVKGSHND